MLVSEACSDSGGLVIDSVIRSWPNGLPQFLGFVSRLTSFPLWVYDRDEANIGAYVEWQLRGVGIEVPRWGTGVVGNRLPALRCAAGFANERRPVGPYWGEREFFTSLNQI